MASFFGDGVGGSVGVPSGGFAPCAFALSLSLSLSDQIPVRRRVQSELELIRECGVWACFSATGDA